jgi:ferredoxin-NADP reductase
MLAKLEKTTDEAKNTRAFWFSTKKPLRYQAGQFVEITLPLANPDERGNKHWFTLSSSPSEPLLAITTRLLDNKSTFKSKLNSLNPGDTFEVSEPMGDFVLPKDKSRSLIFVAAGIGITPFRSMVKWLTDDAQKRPIHLIYAVRTIEEAPYLNIFQGYPLKLNVLPKQPPPGWTQEAGILTGDKILALIGAAKSSLMYIAGPESLVEALNYQLKNSNIPEEQIVTDYFHGYD